VTVEIERQYPSAALAERIVRSLAADQPEFVQAERNGATVRFRIAEGSPQSLRATLEDLLACVQAAERTG
jgi:hypothetical protein